ncbi:mannitol dehydrogenase family protein [Tropicimonas sp.]|uniref:mannitol dehydrogenase family protein n=1 Tax=Tropicimonas sp. TaxID=2067044 RepID=UPI003A875AA4
MTNPKTPILQFGTSRFLQAHADTFIDAAMKEGQNVGPVTVVQSSGDAARAGRVRALVRPEGYPVRIRGLENGAEIGRTLTVNSLRRGLSTAADWDEIVRIFRDEATHVISNTADRGFDPQPADVARVFDQAMSYPAKLQLLLRARFAAGGEPLAILPTELIERNGDVLKARVLELAGQDDPAYAAWLRDNVIWANSLVDRIVSEPIEPAGAVAEPYALWAIEAAPGVVPPCQHPAIRLVETLESAEALKLFILNLGHTYMTDNWLKNPQGTESVRDYLAIDTVRRDLLDLYEKEVIPGFEAAGAGDEARVYAATTLDRFGNPFLFHRLADIAGNHEQKIARRIGAFLGWSRANGGTQETPRLSAIVAES